MKKFIFLATIFCMFMLGTAWANAQDQVVNNSKVYVARYVCNNTYTVPLGGVEYTFNFKAAPISGGCGGIVIVSTDQSNAAYSYYYQQDEGSSIITIYNLCTMAVVRDTQLEVITPSGVKLNLVSD